MHLDRGPIIRHKWPTTSTNGKAWTLLDYRSCLFLLNNIDRLFLVLCFFSRFRRGVFFFRSISMGIYYSLMSVFSSPTSTHTSNVHSSNRLEHRIRSKSLKKRRRRHKRPHLFNCFFLGSNHFSVNTQPHTCLFHEYYTLNSSRETLLPVHLHLPLPDANHSNIQCPIQCSMAIRRDSLKLIHCYEDWYSIDFMFDADRPFQLYSRFSN
jgi:hypothetical protein